ncbi:Replication protein A 32 kDa subunit [Heterocephalus glaber]|uniref:Replication protein A 32 kDa subunit n=1 Tax=Heterocephalus glaber TaxID=10181 RepID=G5AUU7_HETGA|nr:Replication protein A 32 kDa subunit [Heterocephalus glaber]
MGGYESYSSSSYGGGVSYTQSPGGFGSPTASQAEKKSRARAQYIVPCTISQLLSATLVDEVFKIGNVEISQVTVVGIIRQAEKAPTNIVYKIDDMTAAPMDVRQWVDTDNKKSLVAFKIMPLEDMNEFTTHILEVVNAHMMLSKPSTQDTGGENTVVPPETYVKVAGHLRSFQNKKSLVAFKIMPLEDMNEFTTHILEVVNAHMMLSKPSTQPSAGRASISNPGMGEPGNFSGNSFMPANGLTMTQNQVLNLIKACPRPEGLNFQDLRSQLQHMPIASINFTVKIDYKICKAYGITTNSDWIVDLSVAPLAVSPIDWLHFVLGFTVKIDYKICKAYGITTNSDWIVDLSVAPLAVSPIDWLHFVLGYDFPKGLWLFSGQLDQFFFLWKKKLVQRWF